MVLCQETHLLAAACTGNPLNRLSRVSEGQISTAWAHLKGKASKVNTSIFLRSKRPRFKFLGSQVLNSQQLQEGSSWRYSLYFKAQLPYAERKTGADSPWSPPSLVGRSLKSLIDEEIPSPEIKLQELNFK